MPPVLEDESERPKGVTRGIDEPNDGMECVFDAEVMDGLWTHEDLCSIVTYPFRKPLLISSVPIARKWCAKACMHSQLAVVVDVIVVSFIISILHFLFGVTIYMRLHSRVYRSRSPKEFVTLPD